VGCPSFQESLVVVFVAVLVLGSTRLPQIGDALGRAVRNFKRGIRGENEIDVTPRKAVPPPDEDSNEGDGPASR
jgi:sec-independent protein translocase protein TatA